MKIETNYFGEFLVRNNLEDQYYFQKLQSFGTVWHKELLPNFILI